MARTRLLGDELGPGSLSGASGTVAAAPPCFTRQTAPYARPSDPFPRSKYGPGAGAFLSEAKLVGAEESNQPDDDQVEGDDIVQQAGNDKNENPGDQRYQGSKTQGDIHGANLFMGT